MIKKTVLGFRIVLFIFLGQLSWSQEVLERIVAIVGDEIILRTELLQSAQGLALQAGINPMTQTEEFEKIKKSTLENLIREKVLLAKAIEDTITVEDQAVETELEGRIQGLIQQLGSSEKVEAYFGSPIRKIKKDYREDIRKGLIVRAVQEKKLKDVQISRREVERFYASMQDSIPEKKSMVMLRHILIDAQPGDKAKERAIEKIREIQDRLRQGEDFEDLAKLYSEDPGTKEGGGDLGFVERGSLFQSFEEAAFVLNPGDISDVVETAVGLHLIQMVEKRGEKAHLRHILIRMEVTEVDKGDVVDTLLRIREKALAGEDFSELAKEYSQDVSTKDQGGDLGWLPLQDLQIQEFKIATDTLDVGQISLPFQTQFGYHLVKVEGKSEARPYSLEKDWDEISQAALSTKRQQIFSQWVEEIKKGVYIEIKEEAL
ncbi:MAG: peptidylprolyl isomerase [bacterium]